MKITNLNIAPKAMQPNANTRVTTQSNFKNLSNGKVTKSSMTSLSSDTKTHSAKMISLRIR